MSNKVSGQHSLIAGCKRKDIQARKNLYELYAPAMFGICIRYMGSRESAQDILQEGFIKVFTKIDSYSGSGSFEGWIRKIFVTTALEHLRNIKVSRENLALEDYSDTVHNWDTSIIEDLSEQEILKCIEELPIGFRTVFNLYVIEGYSHAEISQILNIGESSSRSQLARARQLLQTKINQLYK